MSSSKYGEYTISFQKLSLMLSTPSTPTQIVDIDTKINAHNLKTNTFLIPLRILKMISSVLVSDIHHYVFWHIMVRIIMYH